MLSKKQVFIQQMEIIEKQLQQKSFLIESHFRNDLNMLMLMLYDLTKNITMTKSPLTDLLEINEYFSNHDMNAVTVDELIILLTEKFKNSEKIKDRLKLGCLGADISYFEKLLNFDDLNDEKNVNEFINNVCKCFASDMKLSENIKDNMYSDDEKQLFDILSELVKTKDFSILINNELFVKIINS